MTEAHLHLRPAGPLVLGFEYRRMETTYATGKLANDHLNVAVGFVFRRLNRTVTPPRVASPPAAP